MTIDQGCGWGEVRVVAWGGGESKTCPRGALTVLAGDVGSVRDGAFTPAGAIYRDHNRLVAAVLDHAFTSIHYETN